MSCYCGGNSLAACLQAKGRSLAAAQLAPSYPMDGKAKMYLDDDAAAMEQQKIKELLTKNILDLSSARILFLGGQRVPPQQRVLWLELWAPSTIWEPLPAGLVVLSALRPEVRQRQSWAL